jgi:RNA polymerase sigma-70 factor (ECF subfamily)
MKDVSDMEIIARVTEGEIDMFELLVERYSPLVFAIAGKRVPPQDAAYVAQTAFVAAWRSLPDYKGRRPFGNWLSVIAMRSCCDYWRQRGAAKNQTVGAPAGIDMQDFLEHAGAERSVSGHESETRRADAAELVNWLLEQLKPEDRLLMDMVYLQRRPLKEAAEALDWSIAKTKIRAMRARHRMRLLIAGMDKS